jgi:hypothetical protein
MMLLSGLFAGIHHGLICSLIPVVVKRGRPIRLKNALSMDPHLTGCYHLSLQCRLTFQWDLWNGRPLSSLAAIAHATCRFLQTAATSLVTSSNMYPLR